MVFLIGIISKLLRGDSQHGPAQEQYYHHGPAQPQFHHKSCRQMKHERRLARQVRRTEMRVARAERRHGGCCSGKDRRRELQYTHDAPVDRTYQSHEAYETQTRGFDQQPNTAPGLDPNGDQHINSAEWAPLSVPDEAPPSYKEVVKA